MRLLVTALLLAASSTGAWAQATPAPATVNFTATATMPSLKDNKLNDSFKVGITDAQVETTLVLTCQAVPSGPQTSCICGTLGIGTPWAPAVPKARSRKSVTPEAAFGLLLTASTLGMLAAGAASGFLSDRLGRRPVVIAGGVLIAIGVALLLLAPEWPGPLVAQIVFGIGHGVYSTSNLALVAEVLPDNARNGRDLGLMNVAVAASQALGPLLGITVAFAGGDLRGVFTVAALAALAGDGALLARR